MRKCQTERGEKKQARQGKFVKKESLLPLLSHCMFAWLGIRTFRLIGRSSSSVSTKAYRRLLKMTFSWRPVFQLFFQQGEETSKKQDPCKKSENENVKSKRELYHGQVLE